MHETAIINFVIENFNYICIPIGFVARYLFKKLFGHRESDSQEITPHSEVFLDKIHEYMRELRESRDDAIEDRAQLLMRNKALREKVKELRKTAETLTLQISTHQTSEDQLRIRYDELSLRFEDLLKKHETLLLANPTTTDKV